MKKILSILLTVTMIFSLVAAFRVPTASAAVGLDKAGAKYYDVTPVNATPPAIQFPGPWAVTQRAATPTFTMGDYIDGDFTLAGYDTVVILDSGSVVKGSTNISGGRFHLATGNVTKDGVYEVIARDSNGINADSLIATVLIKYRYQPDPANKIEYCKPSPIGGYILHADGSGASGAYVSILFPNGNYIVSSQTNAYGQFSMMIGPDNASLYQRGQYTLFVTDGYNAFGSNDSVVYQTFLTTTLTWTLDTFINPTIIYENAAGEQSFVLKLFADDGSPVDPNVSVTNDMAWTLTGFTLTQPVKEIAPGFYRFIGTTNSGASYVSVKVSATVGGVAVSVTKMLEVTKLSYFNPQVVVSTNYVPSYYVATSGYNTGFQAGTGSSYCYVGRQVYDNLPCTIGNSLVIYPIIYNNVVPNYWLDPNGDSLIATVSGPVTKVLTPITYFEDTGITNSHIITGWNTGTRYLVNSSGAIKVTFSAPIVWSKANNACEVFDETNACCVPTEPVAFTVCEQQTCTVDKIDTTKNSDGTYNIALTISGDPLKKVDCELCEMIAVHIYTVTNLTDCAPNEHFEVWYNNIPASRNNTSTGISTLPITLQSTTAGLSYSRDGSILTLKNLDLSGLCADKFVVEVFGTAQTSACGTSAWTHPLAYEKTLSIDLYTTTTINATYSIKNRLNETKLTAGVCDKVEVAGAKFTLGTTLTWTYVFGSSKGTLSPVDLGSGNYEFDLTSLLSDAGNIIITGTETSSCKKEVVTITIPVLMPTFTVKIGLLDGSVIDNDHILTEGFAEDLYVTAIDPRDNAPLAPTELAAYSVYDGCELPTSVGCSGHPELCTGINPLTVIGYDNPHTDAAPQFDLMATLCGGVELYVDTFTLVKPTVKVALEDLSGKALDKAPVTVPPVITHVIFTVTDAHAHGAPDVTVKTSLGSVAGSSSGISSTTTVANVITDTKGEADWLYVFTTSGKYYISAESDSECDTPCGWPGINTSATFEAAYVKPVVDTEKPVITIDAPADGTEVNTPVIKVSGKATDNVKVISLLVNGESVTVLPDNTFSTKVALEEGKNIIKIFASDAANNSVEKDLTVTYAVSKVTVVKIQIGSDIMTVNGKAVQIDAPAEIKNGRTFLPLRAISEALGATVDWIAETQGITVTLGKNTIGLQVGNTSAVVNGTVVTLDAAPYIKNSRTMVPFRVIAEGLGATVEWDPALRIVTVTLAQ
jgi:hypothetical protein